MIVELAGLQVFGHHGVEEEEQRLGQLFLFDVQLEVGDRGSSDRLDEAVDYTEVARAIRELSDERALRPARGARHAHRRCADGAASRRSAVRVRVRKPQVEPAGMTVEYSAVTVERP